MSASVGSVVNEVEQDLTKGVKAFWKKAAAVCGAVVVAGGVFFATCSGTDTTAGQTNKPDAAFVAPVDGGVTPAVTTDAAPAVTTDAAPAKVVPATTVVPPGQV